MGSARALRLRREQPQTDENAPREIFIERSRRESRRARRPVYPVLQEQVSDLRKVEQNLAGEKKSLEVQLSEANDKLGALTKERDELLSESQELKQKVDAFEAKQALLDRKDAIVQSLKKHKLDPADTTIVSESWMNLLMLESDDAKREDAIKDRAILCEKVVSSPNYGSRERTAPDNSFDPKSVLEHIPVV